MFVQIENYIILVLKELFHINLVKFLGDNSEEGTPVPIPNTEVKLFSADNSVCKDRTPPRYFFYLNLNTSKEVFFLFTYKNVKYVKKG